MKTLASTEKRTWIRMLDAHEEQRAFWPRSCRSFRYEYAYFCFKLAIKKKKTVSREPVSFSSFFFFLSF